MRLLIITSLLSLGACAGSLNDSVDDSDRFRAAAISWVGGSIEDMIRAWGEPQQRLIEAAPDQHGLVRWRDNASSGSADRVIEGYRCIVEARYAADDTILRVDTISQNCDQRFGDLLDRLTRRGT